MRMLPQPPPFQAGRPIRWRRIFLCLAGLDLVITPLCPALIIDSYEASIHNRFASFSPATYATATTLNSHPGFILNGLDLSGLLWDENGISYAAITNQHIIVGHAGLGASPLAYWNGSDISTVTISGPGIPLANTSDPSYQFYLYELANPIDITPFSIILGNSAGEYNNLPVAMFGQLGRVSLAIHDFLGLLDGETVSGPYNSLVAAPPTADVVGIIGAGPAYYEGGDSNNAVLGFVDGQWGFLGTALALLSTEENVPIASVFNFLPSALDQLPSGVNFTTMPAPEPGSALLVLFGLAACALAGLRQR